MDENSELFLHLPIGYALKNGGTVYSILSVLGDGGFGVTYLAQDEKLQRRVAIKEYYPRDFAGRTTTSTIVPASRAQVDLFNWGKARFLDEARTLARFDHPGIVGVLDFFEANNTAYLVMQYVDGLPISALLKTQSLEENGARTLLAQLISALKIVHSAGYLHRDVKPANIMIHRESGQPVLIDFGAARQSLGSQTHSVTAMASASFSPKEQYLENAPQTAASEVYSICATIYRAMFQAGPPVSISRDEDETLIELDAAEAADHVTPAFASLLRKGLAYHQRNRFQSLEDLQQAMTDAPVTAPSEAKPKKKPAAKKTAAEAPTPSKRIKAPTVHPKTETPAPKPWMQPQWIGLAAVLGLLVALLWPMFGPTTAPQTVTATEPAAPIDQPLPSPCLNGQGQACFTALRDNPAYEFLPNDVQRRGYEMACELGTAPACQLVAAWHKTGIGGPINLISSLDYYDEACRLKEPNGCIERAMILNDPDSGVSQDKDTAIALLKRACDDLSSTRACNILTFDRFKTAPAQTASTSLPLSCLQDDGMACFEALQNDPDGEFLTYAKQREGYEMACELAEPRACVVAANWHKFGIGGAIDITKSLHNYYKACELNERTGCIERALILIDPPPKSNVKRHKPAAIAALKRACNDLSSNRACDLLQTARFQTAAPPTPATPPQKLVENLRLQNRAGEIINLRASLSFQKPRNKAAIDLLTSCLNANGVSCSDAAFQIIDKTWTAPGFDNARTHLAERACTLMDKFGCTFVGIDYENGSYGRAKDILKAYDLYNAACELGDYQGCGNMAWLIVDNQITGKSYSSVERKVNQACDYGIGNACNVIGIAFGRGFVNDIKDLNRAAPFFEKACDLNLEWGCANLGMFFEYGQAGKTVSKSEAKKLYTKACTLGHKDACDWAKQIGE